VTDLWFPGVFVLLLVASLPILRRAFNDDSGWR
jgi:hypothetical protein